jgi:hypothetical protein
MAACYALQKALTAASKQPDKPDWRLLADSRWSALEQGCPEKRTPRYQPIQLIAAFYVLRLLSERTNLPSTHSACSAALFAQTIVPAGSGQRIISCRLKAIGDHFGARESADSG